MYTILYERKVFVLSLYDMIIYMYNIGSWHSCSPMWPVKSDFNINFIWVNLYTVCFDPQNSDLNLEVSSLENREVTVHTDYNIPIQTTDFNCYSFRKIIFYIDFFTSMTFHVHSATVFMFICIKTLISNRSKTYYFHENILL